MKQSHEQRAACAILTTLALALSACGGGGSSTDAGLAAGGSGATSNAFAGTAYLKTRNSVLFDGKTTGLARDAFQALVDQCNGFRASYYDLAPVSPSEATLASIDVSIHEKFFDTNKALTLITGTGLELVDLQRWVKELTASAKTGAIPAVPPNCAEVKVSESKNGTLWRDGIKYDLRFSTSKAIGNKAADGKVVLSTESQFAALPADKFAGQTCREVAAPAGTLADGKSCIWDAFPHVAFLNWPFAFSGRVQFGPTPGLVETIVPIEVKRNHAIAASVFEIPAGFSVTPPN